MIVRICCFSPCLEQVLETVSSLRENGFEGGLDFLHTCLHCSYSDVTTQEVLIRTHEIVAPPAVNATPPLRSVSSIVGDLKTREAKKHERRILQMKTAREKARQKKEAEAAASASKGDGDEQAMDEERAGKERSAPHQDDSTTTSNISGTKRKLQDRTDVFADEEGTSSSPSKVDGRHSEAGSAAQSPPLWTEPETNLAKVVLTRPSPEMRGHTSYLTFAAFYPEKIRQQLASMTDAPTGVSTPVLRRVDELTGEGRTERAASQDTDYGSEGIDEMMGTMTEEDIMGMGA